MKKNRLIPFSWLPASWGLSGPYREEQEARYYYDGYELEEKLAELYMSSDELTGHILDLKATYGLINEEEYDLGKAQLIEDEIERQVAVVEAKVRSGEIDPNEGEKEIATLRGEPWIKIINDGLDEERGIDSFFFEFDWNTMWIMKLREAGYTGATEEILVQAWFQDVCRLEASASMGAPPINGGFIY